MFVMITQSRLKPSKQTGWGPSSMNRKNNDSLVNEDHTKKRLDIKTPNCKKDGRGVPKECAGNNKIGDSVEYRAYYLRYLSIKSKFNVRSHGLRKHFFLKSPFFPYTT